MTVDAEAKTRGVELIMRRAGVRVVGVGESLEESGVVDVESRGGSQALESGDLDRGAGLASPSDWSVALSKGWVECR